MTKVTEPNFSIELPNEWSPSETSEPGEHVYAASSTGARLVVTLLGVKPLFAIADQQRLLDDYMGHRARYEQGQVPTLKHTQPISKQAGDTFVGGWAATDYETGRVRQHHTVLAGTLLADFMMEAGTESEFEFAEKADAAFLTIAVTPPDVAS